MRARAMIRARPNGLGLGASIACPFVESGSSRLGARSPEVIVAKSRCGSYQPPNPCPTQVGGGGRAPAVPSLRGADPIPLAHLRGRRDDRAAAGRGDARSAGRSQLAGCAADDAVVRASRDRDPLSPDPRTAPISLRPGGTLATGGRDLVRRLAADRKSTRLNSSHITISYAVFCLKKK